MVMVSIGKGSLANPDFIERLKRGAPLSDPILLPSIAAAQRSTSTTQHERPPVSPGIDVSLMATDDLRPAHVKAQCRSVRVGLVVPPTFLARVDEVIE